MTITQSIASSDPHAGQAAAELLATADETPIPESPDTLVKLPGGWINPHGGVERTAEIRELTGTDEEALSRSTKDGEPDWQRFMSEVLARGLVTLGEYPVDAAARNTLLVGDQAAILLGIRRATYGDEYETTIACPHCTKQSPVAYDLRSTEVGGDIEYSYLDDPEELFRTVKLRKGLAAEVRLVTIADQTEALKDERLTVTEHNTILLARCVQAIGGMPTLGVGSMRDLSAGNRRIIEKHLNDTQPGPNLGEVKGQCPVCQREVSIALNMAALFL